MVTFRITALAAAFAVASWGIAEARPNRAGVPTAVAAPFTVDVSRLRALGLGPTADLVQEAVTAELRSQPLPSSGQLVVRIAALSLTSLAGADTGGGGGTSGGSGGAGNFDYMEGEAVVVGPGGTVLRRLPIVMSLPSSSGGPYYLPDVDKRRVIELSRNFARWVERSLG